jgi:hypothetical protein
MQKPTILERQFHDKTDIISKRRNDVSYHW